VRGTGLHLLQVIPSGGQFPTSVAVDDRLVYVLNAGGDGTIIGFHSNDGRLTPIPGSVRSLGLGNGPVPFAFVSDGRSRLVLVDAKGTANTYQVLPSGALRAIGAPVANGQMATCWLAHAGRYFYATNTASNTITGYAEAPDGQLSLLCADGVSATTDKGPIDIAAAPDSRQVFELNGLAGDLRVFAVAPDRGLTLTGTVDGLPAFNGSNGMLGIAVT
jgi:hypothetical protein